MAIQINGPAANADATFPKRISHLTLPLPERTLTHVRLTCDARAQKMQQARLRLSPLAHATTSIPPAPKGLRDTLAFQRDGKEELVRLAPPNCAEHSVSWRHSGNRGEQVEISPLPGGVLADAQTAS